MKKVFTLRGTSKCGKTTKIKKIAEWLLDNYFVEGDFTDIDFKRKDMYGIIEIQGLIFAFVGAGDSLDHVKKLNDLIIKHKDKTIDIVVNSCHNGRGREYIVSNYQDQGWDVTFIEVQKLKDPTQKEIENRDNPILEGLKKEILNFIRGRIRN